ncbi:MAG: hypothetical protein GY694_16695 [Gammaproteobacteria bacterium]|nr:hypothetical protein [Gammaproteobacteria bacterium]
MQFSQDKSKNFRFENIPTNNQYKVIFNLKLIIVAIAFSLSAGSFLVFRPEQILQYINFDSIVSVIFISMFLAYLIILQEQFKKISVIKKWPQVRANCQCWYADKIYLGVRKTWYLAILCTYKSELGQITTTPKPAMMSWFTEKQAILFLNSKIDLKGDCVLLVNPDDPVDSYLYPLDNRHLVFIGLFGFFAVLLAILFVYFI